MTIMHMLYLALAFMVLQVVFSFLEKWLEHHREGLKRARHGSVIAFVMHPATVHGLHDLGIYVAAEIPKLVLHHG